MSYRDVDRDHGHPLPSIEVTAVVLTARDTVNRMRPLLRPLLSTAHVRDQAHARARALPVRGGTIGPVGITAVAVIVAVTAVVAVRDPDLIAMPQIHPLRSKATRYCSSTVSSTVLIRACPELLYP